MSAEQQQEALRQQLWSSSGQLHSLQQQEQQSKQALADSTTAQAQLASNQAILQERCASLQAQVLELQQQRSTSTSQTDSAALFQVLEQQLVSLTGLLRQKEQQVAALQQTVQQQCDERTVMQIKMMQMDGVRQGKQQSSVTSPPPPLEQRRSLSNDQAGHLNSEAGHMHMPSHAHAHAAPQSCSPSQTMSDAKVDRAAQRKDRLNRLASASEQQQGKSGLLGRIMATSSTTGKTVF